MYAEEPIHAGAGTSTGTIDLPIQRERHINVPKIEGSGVRGAIREAAWEKFINEYKISNTSYVDIANELEEKKEKLKEAKQVESSDAEINNLKEEINDLKGKLKAFETVFARIFGFKNDGEKHSAIDISDAHLLFFPVRSWKGVFAWLTSPLLLKRFIKDYNRMFDTDINITIGTSDKTIDNLKIDDNEVVVQIESDLITDNKALFEEYLFSKKELEEELKIEGKELGEWFKERFCSAHAIIDMLPKHIAVVSDDVFLDFADLYTHKITRNKIDSATGTAEDAGLFNEEFLPSESILYANLVASNEFTESDFMKAEEVMEFVEEYLPPLYKTGGDQGIGKGLFRVAFYPKDDQKNDCKNKENEQ